MAEAPAVGPVTIWARAPYQYVMAFAAARGRTADQSVDETADFEARLQPLYAEAVRLAYGMLRNSALAEDAAQDAALRAWRSRGNLRVDSDLRPWFLAIYQLVFSRVPTAVPETDVFAGLTARVASSA